MLFLTNSVYSLQCLRHLSVLRLMVSPLHIRYEFITHLRVKMTQIGWSHYTFPRNKVANPANTHTSMIDKIMNSFDIFLERGGIQNYIITLCH